MTSKTKEDEQKCSKTGTKDNLKKKKDEREIDQAEKDFNVDSELDEDKANEAKIIEIGSIITAPTKLHDWFITRLIGKGAFAKIFMGKNHPSEKFYALKIESRVSKMDFSSNEITVMRCLTYPKELPHFPKPICFIKERSICYIAMTLLGKSLGDLKLRCPDKRFLRGTWSRIGIQALYGIKLMHEKGFIHRDIKPENLLMGAADDQKRWRIVHVIDFGLARQWAVTTDKKAENFLARPLRSKVPFRGSLNFASPNAHLCYEQGRRDDLWSLLFTLVELNSRVPWFGIKEHSTLAKQKTDLNTIIAKMPKSFERLVDHLNGLTALQRPNYHMFFNILKEIFKVSGQTPASKYTFEDTELTEQELQDRKVADWEEEKGTFFALDSVKISGAKDCIDKKNAGLMVPNLDKFEYVRNELVEEEDINRLKMKLDEKNKKRGEKNEVKIGGLRVRKFDDDKTKTKLYNEFKSIHPDETYAMRLEDSQNKVKEFNFEVRNANFEQRIAETRNQLAEDRVVNVRNELRNLNSNVMKDLPVAGNTDEQKEEINMNVLIVNRRNVLNKAQLEVIRKKKEAKEKVGKEKLMNGQQ